MTQLLQPERFMQSVSLSEVITVTFLIQPKSQHRLLQELLAVLRLADGCSHT